MEEENINILEKYAKLSEKEKIEIKSFSKGECLMFVGNEHILVKIDSSDFEKNIIEKGDIESEELNFDSVTGALTEINLNKNVDSWK